MSSILVIDDDPKLRSFVRLVLEGEGHEVREAVDGRDGLKAHRDRPADLVLCDLFMPGKEGLETIRELHREFPGLKVVAMSGGSPYVGWHDFLPQARLFGASAALDKPISPGELVGAVRELLRESGA